MPDVRWHKYEDGKTYCGDTWYVTGSAPCETEFAEARADLFATVPDCERADTLAAERVLGSSRCRFKPRGSWTVGEQGQAVPVAPAQTQVMMQLMTQLTALTASHDA